MLNKIVSQLLALLTLSIVLSTFCEGIMAAPSPCDVYGHNFVTQDS